MTFEFHSTQNNIILPVTSGKESGTMLFKQYHVVTTVNALFITTVIFDKKSTFTPSVATVFCSTVLFIPTKNTVARCYSHRIRVHNKCSLHNKVNESTITSYIRCHSSSHNQSEQLLANSSCIEVEI
jgi:hypothetical protein